MAGQSYDFTGKTPDDAIADGLKALKLRQDQVDIEILNKGSRGIFGIGSEPALVRLTLRATRTEEQAVKPVAPAMPQVTPEPLSIPSPSTATSTGNSAVQSKPVETLVETAAAPMQAVVAAVAESTPAPSKDVADVVQPADQVDDEVLSQLAVELLTKMIQLMGFQGEVVAIWREGDDNSDEYEERYLLLDVRGPELNALIGRRGETLDNIQYLLRLMVNQRLRQWKNIVVDIEQYKVRRVTQLTQVALRMAEQVAASGREMSLEPMPANERRIVHLALRDHPAVYTESSGDGERRKVNIVAKRSATHS